MTGVGEKAAYVRAERDKGHDGKHHCHWPGCATMVAPALWGCLKHWRKLPMPIQRRIWRTFREGQEKSKTPSREYVAAAREAQDWIAENHPPEAKLFERGRSPARCAITLPVQIASHHARGTARRA